MDVCVHVWVWMIILACFCLSILNCVVLPTEIEKCFPLIAVFPMCRHLKPLIESLLVCLSELFGIFLIVVQQMYKEGGKNPPAFFVIPFFFFFFVNVCKLFAVSNIPYITVILPRPLDLVVVFDFGVRNNYLDLGVCCERAHIISTSSCHDYSFRIHHDRRYL